MSERYTRLFALEENLYSDGSPVVISAGALLKDNQTGAVLAQLKIRNIGGKTIKAAAVRITCFDTVGKPLEGTAEKEYLDLTAGRDEEFGQKSLVSLPDTSARSFSVAVTWVAFSDNTVWNASEEELSALPKQDSLSEVFGDEELVKQYRLKYGAGIKSFPRKYKDLWFCACGAFNHADEEVCHVCGQKLAALLPFDAEALKAEKDKRLQKEADERRRAEEQAKVAAAEKAARAKKAAQKAKKIVAIVIPVVCACVAFVFLLTQVIIPKQKYNEAMRLIDAGEYDAAYEMLEKLGNTEAIAANKYNRAMEYIDAQDYETAWELLDGLESGDIKEAKDNLFHIIEEKDADLYNRLFLFEASVGDTIFWGSYEQDNNKANGTESIEWVVLTKEEDRLLIISKYALDCQPYNTIYTDITWEACTLRQWLNNDFINTAFSDTERDKIPIVTVSEGINPQFNTKPGNSTQDRLFLLSITETDRFLNSDTAVCKPTVYASAKGAFVADNGNTEWWLRSPGYYQGGAALVEIDGSIFYYGSDGNHDRIAVRPAMWIDLSN